VEKSALILLGRGTKGRKKNTVEIENQKNQEQTVCTWKRLQR